MTYGDNPAQRLLDLFAEVRMHDASAAMAGWAATFGISPNESAEVLRRGAETMALAVDTRIKVTALADDDPSLVLEHFGSVEKTLRQFVALDLNTASVAAFMAPYNDLAAYSLKMAASLLHRRQPESVLPDDQTADLLQQTRDLIDSITASDLGAELKLWIINALRAVESALVSVKVTGTRGIENATDQLLGAMVRQPSRLVRLMHHPVWQAAFGLMTALNLALGTYGQWQELTADQQQEVITVVVPTGPGAPAIEQGPR